MCTTLEKKKELTKDEIKHLKYVTQCTLDDKNNPEVSLPLFVLKKGDRTIHLLGTFHDFDKSRFSLPEYLLSKFDASNAIAFERQTIEIVSTTEETGKKSQKKAEKVSTVGQHLKKHEREKLSRILNKADVSKMSIQDAFSELDKSAREGLELTASKECNIEEYLPLRFIEKLLKSPNKIISLETKAEQDYFLENNTIKTLPEAVDLLAKYINEFDKRKKHFAMKFNEWKRGEINSINFSKDLSGELSHSTKDMITRNHKMTERLIFHNENHLTIFTVVGLAHVVGEKSMVKLLEKNGYRIVQVLPEK